MLEFDEEYNKYLAGTSVRYEMFAKKYSHPFEEYLINNYKSEQYFSDSKGVSIGFFGMGTCEFEMEEKQLITGSKIQVCARTPEYLIQEEIQRVTPDALFYKGFTAIGNQNDIEVINAQYEAILKRTKEDNVIPVCMTVYNVGYMQSETKTICVWCMVEEDEITLTTGAATVGRSYLCTFSTEGSHQIRKYVATKDGSSVSYSTDWMEKIYTEVLIDTTYTEGRYGCMLHNFTYNSNYYEANAEIPTPIPMEFPVFTGIIKKIENQNGIYKVSCNDLSELLDVDLTEKERKELAAHNHSYKYVLDHYALNEDITGWIADQTHYPLLFIEEEKADLFYFTLAHPNTTKRDIVSDIAAQIGACAYMTVDGNIRFTWYGGPIKINEYGNAYLPKIDVDEQLYEDGIKIGEDDTEFIIKTVRAIYEVPHHYDFIDTHSVEYGNGEINLYIKDAHYTRFGAGGGHIAEDIYYGIQQYTVFRESEIEMVGNFCIELGDIIRFPWKDGSMDIPVMKIKHECDGGLITVISSYGKDESTTENVTNGNQNYTGDSKYQIVNEDLSEIKKSISDLDDKIDNCISSIPKVIDNLESDSAVDALSAKQGKVLREMIEGISKKQEQEYRELKQAYEELKEQIGGGTVDGEIMISTVKTTTIVMNTFMEMEIVPYELKEV